jgi:hypothetical protein
MSGLFDRNGNWYENNQLVSPSMQISGSGLHFYCIVCKEFKPLDISCGIVADVEVGGWMCAYHKEKEKLEKNEQIILGVLRKITHIGKDGVLAVDYIPDHIKSDIPEVILDWDFDNFGIIDETTFYIWQDCVWKIDAPECIYISGYPAPGWSLKRTPAMCIDKEMRIYKLL